MHAATRVHRARVRAHIALVLEHRSHVHPSRAFVRETARASRGVERVRGARSASAAPAQDNGAPQDIPGSSLHEQRAARRLRGLRRPELNGRCKSPLRVPKIFEIAPQKAHACIVVEGRNSMSSPTCVRARGGPGSSSDLPTAEGDPWAAGNEDCRRPFFMDRRHVVIVATSSDRVASSYLDALSATSRSNGCARRSAAAAA